MAQGLVLVHLSLAAFGGFGGVAGTSFCLMLAFGL